MATTTAGAVAAGAAPDCGVASGLGTVQRYFLRAWHQLHGREYARVCAYVRVCVCVCVREYVCVGTWGRG